MTGFFKDAPKVTAADARMHSAACPQGDDESFGTVYLTGDTYGQCPCGAGVLTEVLDANRVAQIVCSTELV